MKNISGIQVILRMLRALHHRNYRLFFGGQGISLIGTWMQRIAMSWLVYRLTDSELLLGVVGFSGQIPIFLFAPFAGVVADHCNRRHFLLLTQILSMGQAFLLAFLTLTNTVAIWHIILLSLFLGMINAFDTPVRQSFVLEMVEKKEDLGNAIALNSSLFNMARLLGPSIAGILIALVGEGVCFLLNALSYIAVILALLAMRIPLKPGITARGRQNMWQGLKEGFTYVFGFPPIRAILLLLGLVSLVGMPYTILMPVFAKDILQGGPYTLGFLMAGVGVGALIGAICLASRSTVLGLERWIVGAASLFGFGLVVFALSPVVWLSLLLMVLTGLGMILLMASSNTLLQTLADDDKRGRVMSYYTMALAGMTPFGNLLAGILASKIGAPATLMLGGMACLIGALLFARQLSTFRAMVHTIYIRLGIIQS